MSSLYNTKPRCAEATGCYLEGSQVRSSLGNTFDEESCNTDLRIEAVETAVVLGKVTIAKITVRPKRKTNSMHSIAR